MPTEYEYTLQVTVSQPSLIINGTQVAGPSVEDTLIFARWMKGDKGDPGESWKKDFDIATDEDIDALFND